MSSMRVLRFASAARAGSVSRPCKIYEELGDGAIPIRGAERVDRRDDAMPSSAVDQKDVDRIRTVHVGHDDDRVRARLIGPYDTLVRCPGMRGDFPLHAHAHAVWRADG